MASRGKKTCFYITVTVEGNRKLCFIPVKIAFICTDNFTYKRAVNTAYSCKSVINTFLLEIKFGLIGNMAERTASALIENIAVGRNSVGRGGEDSFNFAESIVFGRFQKGNFLSLKGQKPFHGTSPSSS